MKRKYLHLVIFILLVIFNLLISGVSSQNSNINDKKKSVEKQKNGNNKKNNTNSTNNNNKSSSKKKSNGNVNNSKQNNTKNKTENIIKKSDKSNESLNTFNEAINDDSDNKYMDEYNKFEKELLDIEKNEETYEEIDNSEINDNQKIIENSNEMKPNANDYKEVDTDDLVEYDDDLTGIWNENMKYFEPSTMLTFEIPGNSEEYLFENIQELNTYFRGIFYLNNELDDSKILFIISDPDGEIVYTKEASEGIFYFHTNKLGIYTITIKNNKWMEKKMVTVAIGLGESHSLRSDHLKDFSSYIEQISLEAKILKNEIKYLSSKHIAHIEKMEQITNKAFLYCFLKLFVLIILSFFTIYYVKNLVSNKRVL
ncbi:transmembrane emp24 domain-containing protein, putative [Plasmodium berghei]|uniref:Transmembrane emp24 domain-containing protein, putative n=2 Tax=Plasmodium berghei TaxID=5821 RepID=A0A509AG70_PLABA|nr:transmembrane emp24 domain-containing protein, putative [Plasmodium berghei ANKA]CXI12976.1 transmembrane emp24 domain-containing protein, putative [Plasmodium berghei]SCL93429.1 transmembrane emp24 domain-containing protein, putative [Plasmodium berghei]SCM15862.1 transmembrane emp24 domain-containing protein, putative [Plasmodium berghei]SCM17658.1 transmembrane emp24 domain-containing protein, putative [Plasmodium berghei]SCN23194.1 transmembrane emp24 domain-containing protein, putative|eukprot:XP_034420466.1 transmembrane emp24 domain-containing protein, putative [Plasmodium berghei ANKA]